ncbi:septal ring lytic transglycosylase RlpA family protein [Methylomonas rapida]|jgi:rare lipoprotein A|uniref:Endolytic peptidoglycan transglycosylase RlpA n=1 Tax=Methylomonas rapida TaxID=2963939 RepID=A0ABY7GLK0_9GAMM|nr:septal ring lytic transglycosylase RlpA family protein [Methylomonas rapida]WAR45378.1 septal ring lytic transglycosylase RlpA family protein [Methylomonas rapida]
MRKKNRWMVKAMLSVSLISFNSISLAKVEKQELTQVRKEGTASFYNDKYHGHATTSGEAYDKNGMTAAHNSLPIGTRLRVTNLKNNRSVIVKVNDRLHHPSRRLIDVSKKAAKELGFVSAGLTKVKIEILGMA